MRVIYPKPTSLECPKCGKSHKVDKDGVFSCRGTVYFPTNHSIWGKKMDDILGEEADIGICEFCGNTGLIDEGICCDGCNGSFFCRSICFRNHQNCSGLVTMDGQIVHIGDELQYPSHYDVFTVIEMQGTWVKGGYARGRRHRGSHEMPIIPRLMYRKEP